MHLLITAGGTREYIDPVRFITNASSGRMGYALTRAAVKAGHKVTLISASDLQPPVGVEFVGVNSAAEMFGAVKKHFPQCDCLIMTAAVADYTPVRPAKTKMKKQDKSLTIKLKPTVDILKWAGKKKKKNQIVVGFALEDKKLRANAEKKLREKNLDMIIANTPAAIGTEKASFQIGRPDRKWLKFVPETKVKVAKKIISLAEELIAGNCPK
ncbi:MAG: phosphopantothenoylcysteine decarboxylase [Planctomycetes bacterium]|nr:phosphopantothenoylcysteine decarboxylase [Planctomycetota bacterium]